MDVIKSVCLIRVKALSKGTTFQCFTSVGLGDRDKVMAITLRKPDSVTVRLQRNRVVPSPHGG